MSGATGELFGQIGSREFHSEEEFRRYLLIETDLAQVLQHDNLYVIVTLLGFSVPRRLEQALRREEFQVTSVHGAVWEITHEAIDPDDSSSKPFSAYVALDWESGLAMYYTNFRKTAEIDRLLVPAITKGSSEMDLFVLHPSLMHRMLDSLFAEYPEARVTEFTARTSLHSSQGSVRRPPCKRTIQYWGNDGRDAYPELRDKYGTAISRAVIELPSQDTKLRVSHTGTIAFCNGDPAVFSHILDEHVLPEARLQRSIVYRAKREYVEIGTSNSRRPLPVVIPLTIRLDSPLQYYEANRELPSALESREFQVLAFMADEGSLFLKASLFDSRSLSRFDIWANEGFIKVLPGDRTRLSTLLRFYDFVLSDIDPYAVLEA